MDTLAINKEIASLINDVKNQFEGLEKKPQISQQELQTFVAKVNELNKKVAVWEYVNSISLEPESVEAPYPQSIPVKEISVITPVEVVVNVKQPKPLPVNETQPVVPVQIKTVIDIKKNIGFNDKFEFISELFKGNASDFDNAVKEINSSISIQEAIKKFENLKKKYNWQDDNETAKGLLEAIKKI